MRVRARARIRVRVGVRVRVRVRVQHKKIILIKNLYLNLHQIKSNVLSLNMIKYYTVK